MVGARLAKNDDGVASELVDGKWWITTWTARYSASVPLSLDEVIKFCVLTLQEAEAVVHQSDGSLKIPADLVHMANKE